MRNQSIIVVRAMITICSLALGCASTVRAETPEWFTCPDSSAFDPRSDRVLGARNPRLQRPSAQAQTSADIEGHARLSAMSYAMYDAVVAGADPVSRLASTLRPVALVYGDPGPDERFRRPNAVTRDTRTFYGVVADEAATGRRLVILRGTVQPNEWLRNVQARLLPFVRSRIQRSFPTGARVHNGFLKIYSSLELESLADGARRPFADALPDLIGGRTVTFVGHSLGGALATLAGVDAAGRLPSQAERLRIITFASPRVGDPGFAKLAKAVGRIDRVCNLVDLVPAVPPSTRLAPYVHVGQVYRVSSFDWPHLENELSKAGEQVTCWHSIAAYAYMTAPNKTTEGLDGCRRQNGQ